MIMKKGGIAKEFSFILLPFYFFIKGRLNVESIKEGSVRYFYVENKTRQYKWLLFLREKKA